MTTPANKTPGSFATAYQHWFGPATFLRCPYQPDGKDTDIGLVGVPHCGGNPIEHMQFLGPRGIRNRSMAYPRSHRELDSRKIPSPPTRRTSPPFQGQFPCHAHAPLPARNGEER